MWICPICFEKRQEGYRCRRCGFDKTEDFVRYRTISWVSEKDLANRNRYNPDSVGETGTHFMIMAIITKAAGNMVREKDGESIIGPMATAMRVNLKMI